ncbi:MAG: lysylphosphatidylglycerol synthase transmembrane domain-containing protein [bacterium]|nr:lysylphosphatidylglycerol synthase transmembrane domain-containing protein [bacterium]
MTTGPKRKLYIGLGVVISIVLLWSLFKDIEFAQLGTVLMKGNYFWLIPNVLMIVLTMYQRAYRWRDMVKPISPVPFKNLLAATCVGFMANNVLPLRLGEFVRAYSLSAQDKRISKSASLATIFVERMVFDLTALLLIFGAVFWLSDTLQSKVDDSITFGIYASIGIAIVGLFIMMLLATRPERVGGSIARYMFFLPTRAKETVKEIVMKFADGLQFMRDIRASLRVGFQTLMIWVLMGLSNLFVFQVFGFDVPYATAFVLLVVVSISILLPSSPGFVGVYHVGAVWSLTTYGVAKEDALSCALVLHATQYLVVTLMGFYFLKKEHLSLKNLEEEAVEESERSH